MANSSLTQRILSARDRGMTFQEISAYENIPFEEVEEIVEYWKANYRADTSARLVAARSFIHQRGMENIQDFVHRESAKARMENRDVRRFVVSEIAFRYRIDADIAGAVLDEVHLAINNLDAERRSRRLNIEGMVDRLQQLM